MTMTQSAYTNAQHEQRRAEQIGDGSKITAADFAGMAYAERQRMFEVAPDRYRALMAELDNPYGKGGN